MNKWERVLVSLMVGFGMMGVQLAGACDAIWVGPFTEVQSYAGLVVMGKVVGHESHGIDFKISEVLRGDENRQVIRVWGDPGYLCRAQLARSTSAFGVGTEWILALGSVGKTVDMGGGVIESAEDYFISSSGDYHVGIEGAEAVGVINRTPDMENTYPRDVQRMPLEELKEYIRSVPYTGPGPGGKYGEYLAP